MTTSSIATIIALQAATIVGLCAWILHLKREKELTRRYPDVYLDHVVRDFSDHDGDQA